MMQAPDVSAGPGDAAAAALVAAGLLLPRDLPSQAPEETTGR